MAVLVIIIIFRRGTNQGAPEIIILVLVPELVDFDESLRVRTPLQ